MKKTILLLALGLLCQPLYPQHTEYPQIGAQVFIEPGQTDKQIDGFFRILAQHGFETARIRMFGAHLLRPDGSWDFTLYDKAFDAAGKHGVKLFATLFPPTDELGDVGGFKFPRSKAHLLEIADYIEAVVSHFRGHPALDTWVLQNEPGTGGTGPGAVTNPMADADQRITRGMTSLSVENNYGRTSGALSLFYNWGRHRINDGYTVDPNDTNNPKDYRFNSRDDMMGVSWYQSARLFRGNRLTVGADYYRFGGEAWNRYVEGDRKGERSDIADKSQDEVAGYVDFRQDIGGWLTFDAGLRVDHHSHIGTEWIPQAGLSFHLPHAIELKASASKGFRYPTIREMYMFPPQNPDLKPERMWNYEIAYSQRLLGGRLTYGINLFYIDGENLIVAVPREGTTPLNMNTGKIDNAGVEAQAAYRISEAWSVAANYSYLHMENPVIAAPEHKLYAEAGFARGRWSVSTGIQYVAGLYTSVKANGRGTENTEDFVLWNLRASLRVSRCLALFARGENLLAQRYEINAGYPMPRATFIGGIRLDF